MPKLSDKGYPLVYVAHIVGGSAQSVDIDGKSHTLYVGKYSSNDPCYFAIGNIGEMIPCTDTGSGWVIDEASRTAIARGEKSVIASTASMEYLFSTTRTYGTNNDEKFHKGKMTDGGGLFQLDGEGYYYYDSAKNAAYFNGTFFELYNTIIRPWYTTNDKTSGPLLYAEWSNFLPFNKLQDSLVLPDVADQVDLEIETGSNNNTINNAIFRPDRTEGQHSARLTPDDLDLVDLWFGMTVDFDFYMPQGGQVGESKKDMIFDFHGDDDVFVYINGVLVLDIGGTHAAEDGWINFKTGVVFDPTCITSSVSETLTAADLDAMEANGKDRYIKSRYTKTDTEPGSGNVVPGIWVGLPKQEVIINEALSDGTYKVTTHTYTYKTLRGIFKKAMGSDFNESHFKEGTETFANYSEHTLKFFYMERGGNISYCRLRYNMPILSGELNVAKHVDDVVLDKVSDVSNDAASKLYEFTLRQCKEGSTIGSEDATMDGIPYIVIEPNGDVRRTEKIDGEDVDLKTKDGGKFYLKANEVASFLFSSPSNLTLSDWAGKYFYVTESASTGLTLATECRTMPITPSESHHTGVLSLNPYVSTPAELQPDKTVDVEFENTYVEDLSISKTVDSDANANDAAKEWAFDVSLSGVILNNIVEDVLDDDNKPTGAKQIVLECEVEGSTQDIIFSEQIIKVDGVDAKSYVGQIKIKSGQSAILRDVPVDAKYSVAEVGAPNQDGIASAGYKASSSNASGDIVFSGDNAVVFTNDFISLDTINLAGSKTLMVGQSEVKLSDYWFDFEFKLTPDLSSPDAPMPANNVVKVNKETGEFAFGEISYSYEDIGKTYQYIIKEVNGGNAYVSYDDSYYVATVLVGYDAQTHRVATSTGYVKHNADGSEVPGVASSKAAFTNTYTPPVVPPTPGVIDFQLGASKQLVGADLEAGAFSFALSAIGDAPMPAGTSGSAVATNDASGAVSFPAITVSAEDAKALGDGAVSQVVYEYVITEQAGTDENIEYDAQPVTVKVTITKTASNMLKANVAYSKAGIAGNNVFVNTYTEPEPEPEPEEPLPDTGDDPKDPKPERPDGPLAPTGDSAPIALILTAMALAVAAFAFALRMRRTNP